MVSSSGFILKILSFTFFLITKAFISIFVYCSSSVEGNRTSMQSYVNAPDEDKSNKIAMMREQERLRRQKMSAQIDMHQQSDLMQKFENNLL